MYRLQCWCWSRQYVSRQYRTRILQQLRKKWVNFKEFWISLAKTIKYKFNYFSWNILYSYHIRHCPHKLLLQCNHSLLYNLFQLIHSDERTSFRFTILSMLKNCINIHYLLLPSTGYTGSSVTTGPGFGTGFGPPGFGLFSLQ